MDAIPQLLIDCQSTLPDQIAELREGFREMVDQGYPLDHIPLHKETERLLQEVEGYIDLIEKTEIIEVQASVQEVKENIDVLYDLLEREAHAKAFNLKSEGPTGSMLESALQECETLKEETKLVQQTYHLKEQELELSRQLEKRLADLSNRYQVIKFKIEQNETAHSLLSDELQEMKDEIETIQLEQAAYKEKLQMLRKDEMAAREQIIDIKKRMMESIRLVSKSNIPGLPDDYQYLLADTKESIQNVNLQLEQKPLDMQAVQQYLEVAVLTVDKLIQTTHELIECVMLAERVIQYGNRYKSSYSSVANGLINAELEFRTFNYQEALEQAAAAIEQVEPGALKKIESILKELKI